MRSKLVSNVPVPQLGYRSDIDGLRAIAVAAVILFHGNFTAFRGGFVGVDIFFVISGFLISAISLREWETGRFTVLRFFEKRARRILPALLLVTLVSVPFALTIPDPLQTKHFLESVLHVLSFSSNLHFWGQTGYFDTSAELKPLLHTWSLAVEEQYYILFPFLLLAFVRVRKASALLILASAFLLSLVLAQVLIETGHKSAAFFLLPSRVWEILAGVFCALAMRAGLVNRVDGKPAELLAGAGLVLVLVSIPVFNDNTRTPGAHALIPVVGAALIILFSRSGGIVYRLLSTPPLVFVGLISFSAYLWHQPLFAFARLYNAGPLAPWVMALLCLTIVPLAYLSWRFVETPFRDRTSAPAALSFAIGIPVAAALVLVSVAGIQNYGFIYYRYPAQVASTYETVLRSVNYDFDNAMQDNGDCVFSSRSIAGETEKRFAGCTRRYGPATVVIGDSHGMNIYNVLAKTGKFDFLIGLAVHGHQAHKSHAANWYGRQVKPFLERNRENIDKVLYHQTGGTLWKSSRDPSTGTEQADLIETDIAKVAEFMSEISKSNKAVWIGPFPDYGHRPVAAVFDLQKRTREKFRQDNLDVLDSHVLQSAPGSGFLYVKFNDLYPMPESPFFDRCIQFKDTDHLSTCGEEIVANWISKNGTLDHLDEKDPVPPLQGEAGS